MELRNISRLVLLAVVALAGTLAMSDAAAAKKFKVIYSFCTRKNCNSGYDIYSGLTMDADGNLYGSAYQGGAFGLGTVFELVKGRKHWTQKVLYNFCALDHCADGRGPLSPPIIDTAGNLYGATFQGGLEDDNPNHFGHGVIYELMPNANHSIWSYQVLYTFCADGECGSGQHMSTAFIYPGSASGALYDGHSPLLGITETGGANNYGAVVRFTPSGSSSQIQVLYSFCSVVRGTRCIDGAFPERSGLLMDSVGNLYGTTSIGGTGGNDPGMGTIFKLVRQSGGNWLETVLYNFCSKSGCADGIAPEGGVIMDGSGKIYGTTSFGGDLGQGELYMLQPNGSLSVLKSFCEGGLSQLCPDGNGPAGGLALDASGNVFGTTLSGGGYGFNSNNGGGVLFEFNGSYQVRHSFCSGGPGCPDGEYPHAALLPDNHGNFFSTTELGGKHFAGAVYELTP